MRVTFHIFWFTGPSSEWKTGDLALSESADIKVESEEDCTIMSPPAITSKLSHFFIKCTTKQ